MDPRYPIGRFEHRGDVSADQLEAWIRDLDTLPTDLRAAVEGLGDPALDTPYREGGWTIRQVVHHVPESHMNAYVRCKWALTEERPEIKTYDEKAWTSLPDKGNPVGPSLELLAALHVRWTGLLRALPHGGFARSFLHPDLGEVRLDEMVGHYAWHGRHHLAHVTTALESG